MLLDESVDGSGVPDGTYEDISSRGISFVRCGGALLARCGVGIRDDGGRATAHFLYILDEGLNGIAHPSAIVMVEVDVYLVVGIEEQVALVEGDKFVGSGEAER